MVSLQYALVGSATLFIHCCSFYLGQLAFFALRVGLNVCNKMLSQREMDQEKQAMCTV